MKIPYAETLFRLIKCGVAEVALGIPKSNLPDILSANVDVCNSILKKVQLARKEEKVLEIDEQERLLALMCVSHIMSTFTKGDFHTRTGLYIEEANKVIQQFVDIHSIEDVSIGPSHAS